MCGTNDEICMIPLLVNNPTLFPAASVFVTVTPPPPPPPDAEICSVLPFGVMVTFVPADSDTASVKPLRLLTTCPLAMLLAFTALVANWGFPIAPLITVAAVAA